MLDQVVERGLEALDRGSSQGVDVIPDVRQYPREAHQIQRIHRADRFVWRLPANGLHAGQDVPNGLGIDLRPDLGGCQLARRVDLAAPYAALGQLPQSAFQVAQLLGQPEAQFQVTVVDGSDFPPNQGAAGAPERSHARYHRIRM